MDSTQNDEKLMEYIKNCVDTSKRVEIKIDPQIKSVKTGWTIDLEGKKNVVTITIAENKENLISKILEKYDNNPKVEIIGPNKYNEDNKDSKKEQQETSNNNDPTAENKDDILDANYYQINYMLRNSKEGGNDATPYYDDSEKNKVPKRVANDNKSKKTRIKAAIAAAIAMISFGIGVGVGKNKEENAVLSVINDEVKDLSNDEISEMAFNTLKEEISKATGVPTDDIGINVDYSDPDAVRITVSAGRRRIRELH